MVVLISTINTANQIFGERWCFCLNFLLFQLVFTFAKKIFHESESSETCKIIKETKSRNSMSILQSTWKRQTIFSLPGHNTPSWKIGWNTLWCRNIRLCNSRFHFEDFPRLHTSKCGTFSDISKFLSQQLKQFNRSLVCITFLITVQGDTLIVGH